MKRRLKTDITRPELYRYYSKNLEGQVNASEYSKILKDFNQRVIDEVLLTGKIFYLPFGLGKVSVVSRIPKVELNDNFEVVKHNMPINWKGTLELWERDAEAKEQKKLIYYDNRNTKDKVYRFKWDRSGCRISGIKAYMFTPSRKLKRTLAKYLNENGKLIRKDGNYHRLR